MPTQTDPGNLDNSTSVNLLEGELPLAPRITPGWAVAGVILLGVGLAYALIGIRHAMLHNFLSVAYATGLVITVVIVYLAALPMNLGTQGGFVTAAVLPAIVLGILASWCLREITECFACLLGGFCFSMWLLCLQEGGLLSGMGKVIFIIVLSLAAFATYFTRWTRDWALITTISFTGATSTVLGIDCFSKAGLKEFWAYIWHLNDNLFPLDTVTYPLTRGIRVELATIVLLFCIGIISQKKLWNVVKNHRTKRQDELAEQRRVHDEEELNVGKQIEAETARERRAWERVHGDRDSGFARDSDSEKGTRYTQSMMTPAGSQALLVAEMDGTERPSAVPPKTVPAGVMVSEKEIVDVVTAQVTPKEMDTPVPGDGEINDQSNQQQQSVQPAIVSPVPEIVPLPFRFPTPQEDIPRARASTVATFADDDEEPAANVRDSFAKRLSRGSTALMRQVSQRTSASRQENGNGDGDVASLRQRRDDDKGSVAATIDSEHDETRSTVEGTPRQSTDISSQAEQKTSVTEDAAPHSSPVTTLPGGMAEETLVQSTKEVTQESDLQNTSATSKDTSAGDNVTGETVAVVSEVQVADEINTTNAAAEDSKVPASHSLKAKSTVSVDSVPVSLTQERLPPGFSHVALHYRTNEWAKHLSHAEPPEAEILPVFEQPENRAQQEETPAPLNVEELKQTALTATPAPTPMPLPQHGSATTTVQPLPSSNHVPARGHSRNSSWQSGAGLENPNAPPAAARHPPMPTHRRVPSKTQVPTVQTIAEESIQATSRAASTRSGSSGHVSVGPDSIAPVGFERPPPPPGVTSYDSPQSLLAQRSVALRNKTYGILTGVNTTPELSTHTPRSPSESGSMNNYPVYPQHMQQASLDDVPLSQRRELMRRQSSLGTISSLVMDQRSASASYMPNMSAESMAFDSHQPARVSRAPSQEAREARLASFRSSVRNDLKAGMAVAPAGANGRDMSMLYRASSSSNLAAQAAAREAEMQRNIDLQRSFLMSQKEAEAKRREKERVDKERANQAFTRSMQSGEMFELHREAMRRMQQGANKS
ncbi:hypothetical protein C8035_v011968 [Colletotrichum spinosum]|uniref:TM7S3/TM198-like domain-containing protein n=1 Tax=Colletotrichum spinosum TaxID=1347390 RepID=A0A4V3HQB6_9PEZI|nr:hypothetical protein C8035_v011968 [Colletotrichum spinosum]